jgi:hypothetical protein
MSVWGATQWVKFTQELSASWGVYNAAGTVLWLRLIEGASFSPDGEPIPQLIRSADGGNLPQQYFSRKIRYMGSLRTPVYPSQSIALLSSMFTPVVVNGRKQLPSWTADYFDGIEVRRYVGLRFLGRCELSFDNGRDYGLLNAAWRAQQPGTAPALPEPASTVFPTEIPYCFQDSSGLVSLGGTLAGYKSLTVFAENLFKENFNESQYVQNLDYTGRNVGWDIVLENNNSTMRTNYENQVALAGSVGFNVASPAHAMTFNTQGACFINSRRVDRSFDDNQYQSLGIRPVKDPVTGLDLSFSAT